MTTRQDLRIRQGETWQHVYTHRDSSGSAVDLSGYSARMAIRPNIGGSLEAYLSTGSDADGGTIALGGAAGTVTLSMTAAQAAAMADGLSSASVLLAPEYRVEPVVKYRYDLELVSGAGAVTRALEGCVYVHREVTE